VPQELVRFVVSGYEISIDTVGVKLSESSKYNVPALEPEVELIVHQKSI
jgi:hypothetical protein